MEFGVKKNNKRTILIIILIVIAVALITAGCIWYFSSKLNNEDNKYIGDINQEVTDSTQEGRNLQEEIQKLNDKYSDAIAWVKVPGTSIDTAVFKTTNNDRYLRNDRDNKVTDWGETFMDYRCDINNMTDKSHFIIYGHNTETDDHFTPLLNYKNKDFFDKHQIIEMSTIKGNYKWQVFTVYVTDTEDFYIDTKFENANEYREFLNTAKSKSMYDTNQTISESDTILTLSTCDYSRKNGRFVVQCKLVKE